MIEGDYKNLIPLIEKLMISYAKSKNWTLSKNYKSIIENIVKKGGNCPCRFDKVGCLSCDVEKDIEENGRCHCNLFIKE
jgi:ferredoxin-thioredoxin reductase catalytic subunit